MSNSLRATSSQSGRRRPGLEKTALSDTITSGSPCVVKSCLKLEITTADVGTAGLGAPCWPSLYPA
ncbi:hypothetical protein T07_13075 [Trichinella nelsoni]|uniref:Uncharacterized protein n=1 Tax=Trichinella nelsoni TaxID=6336 RepID=A0A0V0SMF7_9BILA|nr:hypothetical protein T07_13075 [Trichinella nelsoni]